MTKYYCPKCEQEIDIQSIPGAHTPNKNYPRQGCGIFIINMNTEGWACTNRGTIKFATTSGGNFESLFPMEVFLT